MEIFIMICDSVFHAAKSDDMKNPEVKAAAFRTVMIQLVDYLITNNKK